MFNDRKDAAIQLAQALKKYKDKNVIVLGIPRGGAETAFYVAKYLNSDFSLIVSRKLGHPYNPEFALGAIAEDGAIYLNKSETGVSQEMIDEAVEIQKKEIERRIKILRKGKPLPSLKNKIVIIVDDGIATGATMFAAIKMCKKHSIEKIVVAAPVSGPEVKRELHNEADEVVILETPAFYYAVSQAYSSFYNLTDQEALEFMEQWKREKVSSKKDIGSIK
jgi:putative phosphoribosyl transferase